MPIALSDDDVRELLSMDLCIDATEFALSELHAGAAANPPRSHGYLSAPDSDAVFRMKLFHGGVAGCDTYALRVVRSFIADTAAEGTNDGGRQREERRRGELLVYRLSTGELRGVIDDDELQLMRVGAETAVAAKHRSSTATVTDPAARSTIG